MGGSIGLSSSSVMEEHIRITAAKLNSVAAMPRHCSSLLVVRTKRAMEAAGHICSEIEWSHTEGRHSFTVETEFGPHRITVSPPDAMMSRACGKVAE